MCSGGGDPRRLLTEASAASVSSSPPGSTYPNPDDALASPVVALPFVTSDGRARRGSAAGKINHRLEVEGRAVLDHPDCRSAFVMCSILTDVLFTSKQRHVGYYNLHGAPGVGAFLRSAPAVPQVRQSLVVETS